MKRVAVIGCGMQGRLHLGALDLLAGVQVEAACDLDEGSREAARRDFALEHVYADYTELLARHAVDLVCVCTMTNTHRKITLAALGAGANVLCEKPLAMNAQEGDEMVSAASAASRFLTVGFNLRFAQASLQAHALIASGYIGRPLYAWAWSRSGTPGWGQHHRRHISGGGVLAGSAVHTIDLVRWLAGNPDPVSCSAFLTAEPPRSEDDGDGRLRPSDWDCDNMVHAQIRFAGGFVVVADAEWVLGDVGLMHAVEIVGDERRLQFRPFVSAVRSARHPHWSVDGPGGELGVGYGPDRTPEPSVNREMAEVVGAMSAGRNPMISAEEALVVQQIIDGLYASAASGREVALRSPSGTFEDGPRLARENRKRRSD